MTVVVPKLAIALLRAIFHVAAGLGGEEFLRNPYAKLPGVNMAQLKEVYDPDAVLAELSAATNAHKAKENALAVAESDATDLAAIELDDNTEQHEIDAHNAAVTEANNAVAAAKADVATSRKAIRDLKKEFQDASVAVENATQKNQKYDLERLARSTAITSKVQELVKAHDITGVFHSLVTGGGREICNSATDGGIQLNTVISNIEARVVAERLEFGKYFPLQQMLTNIISQWMANNHTFHQGSGDAVADLISQIEKFHQVVKDLSEEHGLLIITQAAMRESVVHALTTYTDSFGTSNIADTCSELMPGAILGDWLLAVHARVAMLAGKSGVPPKPTSKLLAAAAGTVRTLPSPVDMESYFGQYLNGQHRSDCPAHPGKGHNLNECDQAFFHAAKHVCQTANRKFVKEHLEPNREARSAARKKALPAPKAENIA